MVGVLRTMRLRHRIVLSHVCGCVLCVSICVCLTGKCDSQVAGAGHTRLCVKGLPKHLTNERLRKHFEGVAEVTDARVCTTSDGKSRNFGFIGFRTEKDAQKCLKHFDSTYIDTSQITCEIARPKGDEQLARPWSRYSEGSSANQRAVKKNEGNAEAADRPRKGPLAKDDTKKEKKIVSKDHDLLERAKTDPHMKAFVDAFKARAKTKVCKIEGIFSSIHAKIIKAK